MTATDVHPTTEAGRGRQEGQPLRIAVIGAGFGGLGTLLQLRAAGYPDVTVYERADEIGGTWRDNTYPGCACDIPSVLYSFSFEPNPDWSRVYPPQPEIQQYLLGVVERHGLRARIRLGTEISELRYDEPSCTWTLQTTAGETSTYDVVVNATGPLSRPSVPSLAGLGTFAGTTFHSAHWDHGHDLAGRRVAVVGTGASAIQFVPEIAPVVEHLTVFQRTAPWVFPRRDRALSAGERLRYRRLPILQRLSRWRVYFQQELLAFAMLGNRRMRTQMQTMGRAAIEEAIDDPELRGMVTPSFAPGCKRLLISNDWYPALVRENVELVTESIAEVVPEGIVTADGVTHEADTIIFGTGFAATDFVSPVKVFGRGGIELSDVWHDHAATHLGLSVAGFPNLFLILGPNTTLGHNSVVFMIEAQIRYLRSALRLLDDAVGVALDLRPAVQADSYRDVQHRMGKTVWLSGCHSWYQSADGHVDTLWPGFTVDYWRRTRHLRADEYTVLRASPTGAQVVSRGGS